MGQFAILVLQRDATSGLLRHGFVLDEPVEADTPEEAVVEVLRNPDTFHQFGDSPPWIAEVSAHRAFYERLAPYNEVIFSRARQLYTTTDQEQEMSWFKIIRFAPRRQIATYTGGSIGPIDGVFAQLGASGKEVL